MAFGISLGFNKSSGSRDTSGSNTSSGTRRPIIPGGWQSNYDQLGRNLGFGGGQQNELTPASDFDAWRNGTGGGTSTGQQVNPPVMFDPQYYGDFMTPAPPVQPGQGAPQTPPAFSAGTGLLPGQQGAFDVLQGQMTGQPWQQFINAGQSALGEGANRLGQSARAIEGVWNDTLAPMASQANYQLGDSPEMQAATVGNVADITAGRGADNMAAYANPWQRDVTDAVGNDMEEAYLRMQARNKASATLGGALGGAGQGLMGAQTADDYLRSRARAMSDIRSRGFEVGANLGMADANRALDASRANQAAQMQRALADAQFQQSARQFNAGLRDSRDKFNINANLDSDAAKRAVAGMGIDAASMAGGLGADAANLGLQSANLGLDGVNAQTQAALNAFNAGSIGFDQLMQFLNMGTNTFGEQVDESGTYSETEKTKGKGFSASGSIGGK